MANATADLLQTAFACHQDGKWQEAETLYRSVLAREPDNLNALQLLGLLMHGSGRVAEAVPILQQAVATLFRLRSRDAQHAVLFNNFGNALRDSGNGQEAVAQYRRGLALDPDMIELHVNLAGELLTQGNLFGAVACYDDARRLGQMPARCLFNLACAYAATDRFLESEAVCREALAALVHERNALDSDGAVAAAAESRGRKREHFDGVVALLRVLTEKRQAGAIVDLCRSLVEAVPHDPEGHLLCARSLRGVGDLEASIAAYRSCLQLNPCHPDALVELGMILVKAGFGRLALPALEMAIVARPDDASCHVELGNLLQSLGESRRALACFQRACILRPITTWAAQTRPADFSVLLITAPGAGNTPPEFLLGKASYDRHFFALLPDAMPDLDLLRAHGDIVINMISDVDQGSQVLSAAADLIDRIGKSTVNHPRGVMQTGRDQIASLLSDIRQCRIPRTLRCRREVLASPEALVHLRRSGLSPPFLLRAAGTHGGDAFEKISNPDEVLNFLAQNPGSDFYASEYVDYQSRDGFFRKYRFMFTNGEILPYHLAIADQWKVHHFRTDMGRRIWMQTEEKAFLENPGEVFRAAQYAALGDIQARVGLDFFGVDCSLDREGRVVVFEVNASMLVHNDNNEFPYKTSHCARVKNAFDAMLCSRAAMANRNRGTRTSDRKREGQQAHDSTALRIS